jgi:choline monooxygenase
MNESDAGPSGGILDGILPTTAYTEAAFELERERLFPGAWCAVTIASMLPEPGDALPIDFAGWPLLLVRSPSGEINAFFNICRHRGMRLVDGWCRLDKVIRCPWHSWTYDLDGNLTATPNLSGWKQNAPHSLDPKLFGLKQLRVAVWNDIVFVNVDGQAAALGESLQELAAAVRSYDFSAFQYSRTWNISLEGNWKVVMEGGLEDYHTPWGHPQYVTGVEDYKVDYLLGPSHGGYLVSRSQAASSLHGIDDKSALPAVTGLDGDSLQYYIINLFPNTLLALERDHLVVMLFMPESWDRTKVVFYQYFVGDAAHADAFRDLREAYFKSQSLIFEQDAVFVKAVHESLQMAGTAGVRPVFSAYWERAVQHFQGMAEAALARPCA